MTTQSLTTPKVQIFINTTGVEFVSGEQRIIEQRAELKGTEQKGVEQKGNGQKVSDQKGVDQKVAEQKGVDQKGFIPLQDQKVQNQPQQPFVTVQTQQPMIDYSSLLSQLEQIKQKTDKMLRDKQNLCKELGIEFTI